MNKYFINLLITDSVSDELFTKSHNKIDIFNSYLVVLDVCKMLTLLKKF